MEEGLREGIGRVGCDILFFGGELGNRLGFVIGCYYLEGCCNILIFGMWEEWDSKRILFFTTNCQGKNKVEKRKAEEREGRKYKDRPGC